MSTLITTTVQGVQNIKYDSSTTAMTIDSDGRILQPNKPAFSCEGTNYTQGTGYAVVLPNSMLINVNNCFNASNGKFTAPIAGNYIFGFWGLSYNHSTEVNRMMYWKNGSASGAGDLVQFNHNSTGHFMASGGVFVPLAASDYIELRYDRTSGSGSAWNSQWNMWGYLVS